MPWTRSRTPSAPRRRESKRGNVTGGAQPMAWERRKSRVYFYRRRRIGGRRVRLYVGRGPLAEVAAAVEAARRRADALGRRLHEQQAQRWADADAALGELSRLSEMLLRAALRRLGYHQHHRGEWRRSRSYKGEDDAVNDDTSLQATERARAEEIIRRARQGDRTVLPQLTALLDAHPESWSRFGDLAAHARAAWVILATGDDLLLRESLERKLDALQKELLAEGASPLEEVLAGRVVACHLQVAHADAMAAQARTAGLAVQRALLFRQESAQRRLLAAAKALALCRRLVQPAARPSAPGLSVHRAG